MSIVVSIVGNEIWNSAGNTTVEKATNYYASQGSYADSKFGKVTLDKRSAKNSRQHGIGVAKVQAYAVVKDVLEKGTITLPMNYYNTNPNKEYMTGMIAADVEISGQTYTCVVTVCLNNDGLIRVWNHEVTPYTNTKPQGASITNHVSGGETTPHQHQGAMAKIAKEFQKNNKETKESKNMKKNTIKLNENQLCKIVAESVKKVLKEYAEGNEFSAIPGENYSPTPKSLIETIINEAQYLNKFRGEAERCIRKNDVENALTLLRKIGYSTDVIIDRANELQGFIENNSDGEDI